MTSDDNVEQNSRRKIRRTIYSSSDSEDGVSDTELLNRKKHDENTLPQFMTDQEDWSPFITDSALFEEYNQEHIVFPEIDYENPFSIYKLFLSDDIIDLMVLETNKYYEHCVAQVAHSSVSARKHKKEWKPTTRDEMYIFIGILLIMGVVKVPEIRLYWSTDPMFTNERIKSAMKRERFLDILQYWHFSDNDQDCSDDQLFKISTLVEKINRNFREVVKPGKELTIDESMIPRRGRLQLRQNIPNKYGIKMYKLSLVEGYTYKIKIYSGTSPKPIEQSYPNTVVMELMDGLLHEGRILYADNYYTSVPLAKELLKKKTFLCGTLRANSKFLPVVVRVKQKKGDIISVQKEGVKFMKWTDKKQVLMLTTCKYHKCSLIENTKKGNKSIQKPDCVLSYNKAKKRVDFSDQMSAYYSSLRKTIKWYRKIILELICGTMLVNAWCLYTKFDTRKNVCIVKFRKRIIDALLKVENEPKPKPFAHNLTKYDGPLRMTRKRCKNCYDSIAKKEGRQIATNKTKRVNTYCPACKDKPTLCIPCFAEVHK